jgi:hypothetical protein
MTRFSTAAAAAAAAAPTAATVLDRASLLQFRASLPSRLMSTASFDALRGQHRITAQHVAQLEAAGLVTVLDAQCVHCHPSGLLMDANDVVSAAAQWDPCATERAQLGAVEADLAVAAAAYQRVVSKASRTRKALWGSALAFSGTQLAVVSRLTYFDLDWDTMEPISYFLGTGTSLLFFMYMLRHGAEHNAHLFDRTSLKRYVVRPEVARFMELTAERQRLVAAIDAKTAWMKRGTPPQ